MGANKMNETLNTSRLIVIISLLTFNIFNNTNGKSISAPKDKQIIIIGAGAAGIAAASKLFENGFNNVTILEAEDRIGGRVHTVDFANYSVDLGGQWIHGQEGNVAFNLANQYDLLDITSEFDIKFRQTFFDSFGNQLSKDLSENLTNFEDNYVFDFESHNNTVYKTVGEYVEKMFNEQFKNNPEIIKEKYKYLSNMELSRISFDSTDSWRDLPTIDESGYTLCEGDQSVAFKSTGYSIVLDLLMKRYPDPAKELPVLNNTILNTEVTSIDYLSNEEGPSILITTKNGQLYKADHVIVTVSLGVLKEKHKIFFIPPLPDQKVAAIEGIGFGSVAKIYLFFDNPFWGHNKEKVLEFSFVWNDDDRRKVEADAEKKWILGMYSAITVEHKPKLLTLWNTGKYARLMEEVSEDKIFKHAVENLHRFLDKTYNVADPVAMIRSRWYSNPHFRGTYSYRSIESQKRKVYSTMLEEPLTVDKPRILFAGEATSKLRFSTVDGAIGSGWKAADRLIQYYK